LKENVKAIVGVLMGGLDFHDGCLSSVDVRAVNQERKGWCENYERLMLALMGKVCGYC
jgi:hypothetical protein